MGNKKKSDLPSYKNKWDLFKKKHSQTISMKELKKTRQGFRKYQKPGETNALRANTLSSVSEVTCAAVENVRQCKNKSCDLDPILIELLKEHLDLLLPIITKIMNQSLGTIVKIFQDGSCDTTFKKVWINSENLKEL